MESTSEIKAVVPPSVIGEPSETLYIQNINEKVSLTALKSTLRNLFEIYGTVHDVVAHHNIRMRGQAFVSFADKQTARRALQEAQGFPLYSRALRINFAKTRSDAVTKLIDETSLSSKRAIRASLKKSSRNNNPIRLKLKERKRQALEAAASGMAPQRRRPTQISDEALPPNKMLFLQNLPSDITQQVLINLFSKYPNMTEVRLIPTRSDIAFVEYSDAASSAVAREALHNIKLDGETKMKVTFARTTV